MVDGLAQSPSRRNGRFPPIADIAERCEQGRMLGDIRAWIGFVHVRPSGEQQPFDEGTRGGFTHAIALAADADHFRERVVSALSNLGLFAVEFSDVAPVADYHAEDRISDELEKLAAELSPSDPVQFDIFDTYRQHDS